jgi:hypothetical protein
LRLLACSASGKREIPVDADGKDRGKTYKIQRAGNWIEITATPLTYRRVHSINIYLAINPG